MDYCSGCQFAPMSKEVVKVVASVRDVAISILNLLPEPKLRYPFNLQCCVTLPVTQRLVTYRCWVVVTLSVTKHSY
jgi:hypothetical protein